MNARNLSFARIPRPARRRAARLDCRPAVESFERRELMAAGIFLQGTAFVDSNANGALDLGEAKLAGATVKLYNAAGITQLATTTTAADGSYKFTDANVAGGLAADTTYNLVESAAGFSNTGAQPLSQVLKATATSTSTIQVTTVDVAKVTTSFTSPASPFDRIFFTVNGSPESIVPTQLNVVLAGDPNVNTATFPALCVGISDRLGFNSPYSTLVGTQAELPNGGQIAYLFNHYGTTLPASASTLPANLQAFSTKNLMAGVQVAIWQLEYGSSLVLTGYDAGYTSTQDYADLNTAAAFFVADAAGKSELSAVLDASLTGTLPAAGLAGQSLLATGSLNFGNAPIPLGSLSGFVYVDNNNSGQKLPGDAPIAGVMLTLVRTDTASPVTIGTTTTAADGSYSFAGLTPSTYKVVETQPSAYLDGLDSRNGAIIAGSAAGVDTVAGIVVTAGNNSPSNNFGELAPASVAGTVYFDKDASGTLTAGDVGLSGVTVTLTGTNDLGAITPIVATTGPGGTYSFGNLRPGTYAVAEAQPAGYAQGTDTVGAVGTVSTGTLSATDVFSGVALAPGTAGVAYNFGELGTGISGTVFYDANKSTTLDAGDSGLGGLTVTLKNAAGAVVATTITAANGTYSFPNVAPGTYTVVESVKPGYGTDTPVTLPVTVATTPITGINFGQTLGSLAGNVYFDNDASGTLSTNDLPLGGVTVNLLNSAGTVIQTTATAADGTYLFTGLTAGTYGVSEVQPALYSQGTDTPGSVGGSVTAVDVIAGANLPAGVAAVSYNFGETYTCDATLSHVYYTINGSTVVNDLRGNVHPGDTVSATFTVAAGHTDLLSLVSYSAPAGYFDANTASQQVVFNQAGGSFGPGTYTLSVVVPNSYFQVDFVCGPVIPTLGPAGSSNFYSPQGRLESADNGGGQAIAASSLAGTVFADTNRDGVQGTGEVGIAEVTVTLAGATYGGVPYTATTATNPTGGYIFAGVPAGTYTVTETTPAGLTDGRAAAGTSGGVASPGRVVTIPLNSNTAATGYNFAEVPPSTLSGYVYVDANDNGVKDAGDAGIAGVAVRLAGIDDLGNPVSAATTTDAGGAYSFGILRPGTYVVTETQPAGYLDGLDSRNGAVLGGSRTTDVIGGIVVGPGGDAPANNFGELVASTLGGNVYLDKNSDGSLDNAEVGIAGVTLKLTGTNDLGTAVSLTTITGPAGAYSFADLRPGTYVVTETQPAGYTTTGNSVGTVNGVTDGILDRALADVISNIVIPGGVAGINYNFGEIRLVQTTTPKPLVSGDTATIGYWAHSGQALILSLNGGSTSTQLATWLSSNFPGLFPTSLIGTTNQGVANYMKAVFRGQSPKAEAQVLAVALAAYATDSDLAGTTATAYGFNVSASGTAAKTYNVGSNGPSLGLVANGLYSILDLLYAANIVAVDGGLYVNDNGLRSRVTSVFDGINIAGDRI